MKKSELKIVFMGTPDFAVASLAMLQKEGYCIAAVVTNPDRPKGRGHKLMPPPVKVFAEAHNIPVYQYEKVSREGLEDIKQLKPDLIITAAFGQILSRELLAVPKYGCINVHGSLLPKYRGAAPVQWAIINGEKKTGITTMYTVYELDAGDMLLKKEIEIDENISGGELFKQLADVGADCLKETLELLLAGELRGIPQNESEMTYYPMFEKGFGKIDFSKTAEEIHNFVRALDPDPGAYAFLGENKIKIFKASKTEGNSDAVCGTIVEADAKKGLLVAVKDGILSIDELQYPGSKRMSAKDYLRGRSLEIGLCFE